MWKTFSLKQRNFKFQDSFRKISDSIKEMQVINTTAPNAGVLRQQGALERLIHLDEGFKFLRALRGSPLL